MLGEFEEVLLADLHTKLTERRGVLPRGNCKKLEACKLLDGWQTLTFLAHETDFVHERP